jgi:ribonuclease VapC
MTYIEPSAVLSILLEEPDARILSDRLAAAERREINVVGSMECVLGLGKSIRDYGLAAALVERFMQEMRIDLVGVPADQFSYLARAAVRYGKGTGHPAQLNMGDLFSYAHCKRMGIPILFKGNDFSHTDLTEA